MPTYEYACKSCGTHIDVVQSFTDDTLTTCETCGGDLRKVFGAVGISFKGSGFYKNDSRAASSTKSTATPEGSSDSKSSETKTESTPAKTESTSTTSPNSAKAS